MEENNADHDRCTKKIKRTQLVSVVDEIETITEDPDENQNIEGTDLSTSSLTITTAATLNNINSSSTTRVLKWDDISLIESISQLVDPTTERMDLKYTLPPELRDIDFTERVRWNKFYPFDLSRPLPYVPIGTPPPNEFMNTPVISSQTTTTLCHHVHALSGRARACTVHFLPPLACKSKCTGPGHRFVPRPLPTPMFMPVGTKGCLKALSMNELITDEALQCPIILGNTYHLAIQPGTDLIAEMNGLHHFQGLPKILLRHQEQLQLDEEQATTNTTTGSVQTTGHLQSQKSVLPYNLLTDSGGFQMVSLAKLSEVTEEGVIFENPYNQRKAIEPSPIDTINTTKTATTTTSAATPCTSTLDTTATPSYDKDFQHSSTFINDLNVVAENDTNEEHSSINSHENGTTDEVERDLLLLRPEDSIRHQNQIGSNILMALDDVIATTAINEQRFVTATHRTLRWYDRCYDYHHNSTDQTNSDFDQRRRHQNLFPIVQGGLDITVGGLREQCLAGFRYREQDCHYQVPGYAIGGLSGGESKEQFWRVVDLCCKALPDDKPRYLMGVGYPLDLVVCTALGVDLYDCVYPTRTARFGVALVPGRHPGTLKLRAHSCGRETDKVIQPGCPCQACRLNVSRARLHLLLKANNPIAVEFITQHNLVYMMTLVRTMREAILKNEFPNYVRQFVRTQFPGSKKSKIMEQQQPQEEDDIPKWVIDALNAAGIEM